MIQASIVGGSGYAGGELLRLLLGHPKVEVAQVTSERFAGSFVYRVHPNLRGRTRLKFTPSRELGACDLLFLALPHGVAQKRIGEFAEKSERVIDLSSDFRLRDPAAYPHWYNHEHEAPEWLGEFVYGLPELHREEIRDAHYVTSVGCNAASVILGLWPLCRRGLVQQAVVEVKVGSSEGGNKPGLASHHPERSGAVRSFAPTGHRHLAEMEQELGLVSGQSLHFSATAIEMVRGVLATAHCFLFEALSKRDVWKIYREDYGDEPFVRLVAGRRGVYRYPEPKIIAGSNFCDVGFARDEEGDRLVMISALDNLMKGAAGNAVQAMNVMYGWEENLGLEFPGLHPV
ncbi:MAG: N-acetyl-gamma-glutamyl-phosphate reductase [Chloroflexota bacterium]|nr:N-acetyl-gamma-glutamyl-phosphate reductase [Chloroflexota bacterium]